MDIEKLKNEFYQCIKEALKEFSKSEENKCVYTMALDCMSDIGGIALRYRNEKHFQTNLASYEEARKKNPSWYINYGIYGLHGSQYAVGEYEFIQYKASKLVKHFLDSCCYHCTEEYYGEGEPIEAIKENYKAIYWDMIIDTINKLKNEIVEIGIDITGDFIFFHCDHDQSFEERDKMIRYTVSEELMQKLIDKK